jgi:hypothetical protein
MLLIIFNVKHNYFNKQINIISQILKRNEYYMIIMTKIENY